MGERIVLRAEIFHESRRIVAHTTEVSPTSVLVRTEERIALGANVMLRLSFPRLFAPLQVAANVVSRDPGSGHGYYAGLSLVFDAEPRLLQLQRTREEGPAAGGCRIIVVEDSAVMRDIVGHNAESFSKTFNIRAVPADRAEAALELIEREHFDLAIVDHYLPGQLTGADLVRDLRQRNVDLPVVGFSVGGTKARLAFLDAGADVFLDKPVMLRDVFATLELLYTAAERGSA